MYATTGFPHHVHWSSTELADAVPRRLSELFRFEIDDEAAPAANSGTAPRRTRGISRRYVPASTLPELFRVD